MTDIHQAVAERIQKAIRLTHSLAESAPYEVFGRTMPGGTSNTVGEQFWCINGARESYAKSLENGRWSGFSNSLDRTLTVQKPAVLTALQNSEALFFSVFNKLGRTATSDSKYFEILISLIEHEASHHGQLMRFWFALKQPFPREFALRYALIHSDTH